MIDNGFGDIPKNICGSFDCFRLTITFRNIDNLIAKNVFRFFNQAYVNSIWTGDFFDLITEDISGISNYPNVISVLILNGYDRVTKNIYRF